MIKNLFCANMDHVQGSFGQALYIHDKVFNAGVPNYIGCRIPVSSELKMPKWEKTLEGFSGTDVLHFIQFGCPIGLVHPLDPVHNVTNHKGARKHPIEVAKYLVEEVCAGRILGPLAKSPFANTTVLSL